MNESRSINSLYSELDEDLNTSIELDSLKSKYNSDLSLLKANFNESHSDDFRYDNYLKKLYKKQYNKPIEVISKLTVSFPQNTRKLVTRLDLLKKDNDEIRKKYENIRYDHQQSLLSNQKLRRPYEECYLEKEHALTK